MVAVAELNLKQTREAMAAKQADLGKVFTEAKNNDGQYDFNKVTCLGADVKGSIAVAEKVKQMNAELNELGEHADLLEGAEKAAHQHAEREKAVRGFALPGGGGKGNHRDENSRIKSLGEMVQESKAYQEFAARGAPSGGIDLYLGDLLPSDMLAKGAVFDTLGTKTAMSTGAGFAPQILRQPGFVEMATRPIQLLDIIPMFPTDQAGIKYMEETTRVHAAAEVAEGAVYAESAFAFTERNVSVSKVGDSLPVTDEQLSDVPMMNGYINSRLTFGVRQRLDGQVLIGNGAAPNQRGLKNVAGIQTQAKGADPVPDAFFKAMTKIRVTGRAIPTHAVMHPTDWQGIRLLRSADGVYIWGSPSDTAPERLWGLPVVQQDADAAGTGYVGSFQPSWVYIAERAGIDVQIGYVGTQFLQGLRTIRADMRIAIVWTRPAAFCSVTGL